MGLNDFNRHWREEDRRVTLCGICGEEDEDLQGVNTCATPNPVGKCVADKIL